MAHEDGRRGGEPVVTVEEMSVSLIDLANDGDERAREALLRAAREELDDLAERMTNGLTGLDRLTGAGIVRARADELAKIVPDFNARREAGRAMRDKIEEAEGPRVVGKLIDLSLVQPEKINWWIEDAVPKGLPTVLAAEGGTCKGIYSVMLSGIVDGPIIYLGSEDNHALILVPRLKAAGLDPAKFLPLVGEVVEDGSTRPLRFPRDAGILEEQIEATGAQLVIIDSGIEFMEEGLKSNSAEDVRRFMAPLNDICERLRVTIFVILHLNKVREAIGAARVSGNATWVNANRHTLLAAKDDEDEMLRHVEVVKSNIATLGPGRQYKVEVASVEVYDPDTDAMVMQDHPFLVDAGLSSKSVEELLAKRGKDEGAHGIPETILEVLSEEDEPVEVKRLEGLVAERAGCSPRTAEDHRHRLNKKGYTERVEERDDKGRKDKFFALLTDKGRELIESGMSIKEFEKQRAEARAATDDEGEAA